MTHLHLDCTTGVSGDMLLAALLDTGPDTGLSLDMLQRALDQLELTGYELALNEKFVSGIRTLHLDVLQTTDQPLRHLSDLTRIVENSGLSGTVKERSLTAMRLLGAAEAKVHGVDIETVHFHEIGAVDTIVDIVGVCALVEALEPMSVGATAVNLGCGFVRIAHGTLPVPAPACAELAKGMATFGGTPYGEVAREQATPTGLALVKTLTRAYEPQPRGIVRAVGYGSGTLSGDDFPTYLRAFVIDAESPSTT